MSSYLSRFLIFLLLCGCRQAYADGGFLRNEERLYLGGRKLLLQAVALAHTATDLTVVDEQTDTLFAGDLVFRERLPVLDGSLNLETAVDR